VGRELNDNILTKWQSEWENITNCAITISFFPKITESLKLKFNSTPNFRAMGRENGYI